MQSLPIHWQKGAGYVACPLFAFRLAAFLLQLGFGVVNSGLVPGLFPVLVLDLFLVLELFSALLPGLVLGLAALVSVVRARAAV